MRLIAIGAGLALLAFPAYGQTAAQILDSVQPSSALESMVQGDYPSMKRESNVVGAIQRAWDNAPGNAGVYVARYSPDQVFKIRVREFMTTTVILPEWESVTKYILGDGFGFKAEQTQPHIIVVRSALAGADTSLTVIGESGRVYPFYIRAEGYNSENVPDVAVYVKAERPENPRKADLAADTSVEGGARKSGDEAPPKSPGQARNQPGLESPDWLRAIPFDPSKLRFDFTMSGDKSIAPTRVFSDGLFTYFDYSHEWDTSDLPVVYRVVDGVDTPVNTRSNGTMLIAEAAGAFTLRNGQRVVCVRPAGYVPDGSYTPLPKAPKATSAQTFGGGAADEDQN